MEQIAENRFVAGICLLAHIANLFHGGRKHLNARLTFLAVCGDAGRQTKFSDQEWQAQPLRDQGNENNEEGKKDEEITLGEGRAIVEHIRQRNGCRQGDDAAHARPANDE